MTKEIASFISKMNLRGASPSRISELVFQKYPEFFIAEFEMSLSETQEIHEMENPPDSYTDEYSNGGILGYVTGLYLLRQAEEVLGLKEKNK